MFAFTHDTLFAFSSLQADFIIEGFSRWDGTSLLIERRLIQSKTDEVVAVKSVTVSSLEENPTDATRYIGEAFTNHSGIISPHVSAEARGNNTQQDGWNAYNFNSKFKLHSKQLRMWFATVATKINLFWSVQFRICPKRVNWRCHIHS